MLNSGEAIKNARTLLKSIYFNWKVLVITSGQWVVLVKIIRYPGILARANIKDLLSDMLISQIVHLLSVSLVRFHVVQVHVERIQ